MSADTTALYRSVAKVVNLEGTEEEYVAEVSPMPGPSFKMTKGAVCFLQFIDVQLENAALRQKIFHVPSRKKIIMKSERNTDFTNVLT
jgi:hypothetical protein